MRVLAVQPSIGPIITAEARDRHVRLLASSIDTHLAQPNVVQPDLIVFPELTTIDYSIAAFERLSDLAEDLNGPTVRAFSALAKTRRTRVCVGFPRVEAGTFYISHAVIDASGSVIGHYDKLHIAELGAATEKAYFSPGRGVCVFDIGAFRAAIVICYDFRFGDYIRTLVLDYGADFVIHPVAFTTDRTYASWHHFVITRALEHQIYMLSLNRAGDAWGQSIFCPPWIDDNVRPTVLGREPAMAALDLDTAVTERVRDEFPLRVDRRVDYAELPNTGSDICPET